MRKESSRSTGRTRAATTTCEPSERTTSSLSTFSAEASPAKISLGLETALASMAPAAACGRSTGVSFANYDRATRSWRTCQLSLQGGLEPYSETWPSSGSMRNGRVFSAAPWVRHTHDSECSLWPTPTASMDGRGFGIPLHENADRYRLSTVRRVHALIGEHGWRIHPRFTEALMGFPSEWTAIEPSETP